MLAPPLFGASASPSSSAGLTARTLRLDGLAAMPLARLAGAATVNFRPQPFHLRDLPGAVSAKVYVLSHSGQTVLIGMVLSRYRCESGS